MKRGPEYVHSHTEEDEGDGVKRERDELDAKSDESDVLSELGFSLGRGETAAAHLSSSAMER
jgi:hypothetical protein